MFVEHIYIYICMYICIYILYIYVCVCVYVTSSAILDLINMHFDSSMTIIY